MRALPLIVTVSTLCATSGAFAQSTLMIHPSPLKCESFLSMANHGTPVLTDRVASGSNMQPIRADNALVIDAEAPEGLIVDECSRAPKVTFANEIARVSDRVQLNGATTYH